MNTAAHNSNSKDSLKFCIMGGCGSSGTTLLTHLLSLHPEIASGPEFNLFNHYEFYDFKSFKQNHMKKITGKCEPSGYIDSAVFMTYREYYALTRELIGEWVQGSDTTYDFLARVLHHMYERFSVPYFLEKSPTNVYCFPQLAEMFPETPIIHVIRDGRDVVCSLMKRGFNLHGAASRWLYDTLCGLTIRNAPNYHEVRYEDLVKNPDEILKGIYSFLGKEAAAVDAESHTESDQSVYSENWLDRDVPQVWTSTPSDPISTASIGKYKKQLTDEDMALLSHVTIRKNVVKPGMPDISSFNELLGYLGYLEEDEKKQPSVKVSFARKYGLQLTDYERRLSRFISQYGLKLPKLYTYIR